MLNISISSAINHRYNTLQKKNQLTLLLNVPYYLYADTQSVESELRNQSGKFGLAIILKNNAFN